MAKALTAAAIEKLKPDPTKRLEIPDGLLTGLYLVVQPGGARSWAVRYRHGGKPRKLTIGAYPALSLADAREEARSALRAVATGLDPAAAKKATQRAAAELANEERDLFENVARQFIDRYAKQKNRSWTETARLIGLAPDPASEEPNLAQRPLVVRGGVAKKWQGRRVQEIRRRDVIELLDALVDRGAGTTANRVLAAVRKLFNWALERDILPASPCTGLKAPAPERTRDRLLTDDEIRWLWKATEQQGYPFGPLVRLLLLTGQRREEVGAMTDRELDLDARLWTIPRHRAKNNVEHHVPLSQSSLEILGSLMRIRSESGFLFTSTGDTAVSGYSRAKAALDAKMLELAQEEAADQGVNPTVIEIPHWTYHDLRRTTASGMARLGIPVHVVEAVLNHKSGTIKGVAAVYNRYSYADEKRAALESWGRLVKHLVASNGETTVVPLRDYA